MADPLTYDDCPQFHPMIVPLRERRFHYSWDMVPSDFRIYYQATPVELGGGKLAFVSPTRYISSPEGSANECYRWRQAVRAHAGATPSPVLDSWLKTQRPMAVFNGHGLPEEISLVCQLAVACGYRTAVNLQEWVWQWIGLDCNGFTNAYYLSIGTFNRVMHSHPQYVKHGGRAASDAEVSWDSCMVWAWAPGEGSGGVDTFRPRPNPGNGAHIAVVERWLDYGSTLIVVERGGTNRFPGRPPGITRSVYTVEKKPKAGSGPGQAGWKVRSEYRKSAEWVLLTWRMPTY